MAIPGLGNDNPELNKGGWEGRQNDSRPSSSNVGYKGQFTKGLDGLYKVAGISPTNLDYISPENFGKAQAYMDNLELKGKDTIEYFKKMVPEASATDLKVQQAAHDAEIRLGDHRVLAREAFMNKRRAMEANRGKEAAQDHAYQHDRQVVDGYVQGLEQAIDNAVALV
ncbi:MAG TPA: hypothetical protein V6D10_07310 [Trichocoleus sp.]|jgi:hypothetical protein